MEHAVEVAEMARRFFIDEPDEKVFEWVEEDGAPAELHLPYYIALRDYLNKQGVVLPSTMPEAPVPAANVEAPEPNMEAADAPASISAASSSAAPKKRSHGSI